MILTGTQFQQLLKMLGQCNFQTISIERVRRSNQSNAIELDRTVEIRLPNAIEFQSNVQILGNIRLVRLRFDCVRLRFCIRLRSI